MSGVAIIVQLLLANGDVGALVPSSQIVGDELAVGTAVPALGVQMISTVERRTLSKGATIRITERVQVTALAATRPEAKALIKAVRRASDYAAPAMAGLSDITVIADGQGPDFGATDAGLRIQAQDFMVGYNEPT